MQILQENSMNRFFTYLVIFFHSILWLLKIRISIYKSTKHLFVSY